MAYSENKEPLELSELTALENDDGVIVGDQSDANEKAKYITWANIKTALTSLFVTLTGNQTVEGVKTFSSSPVVPTPTTDMQAATKKYVDDAVPDGDEFTYYPNDATPGGGVSGIGIGSADGTTVKNVGFFGGSITSGGNNAGNAFVSGGNNAGTGDGGNVYLCPGVASGGGDNGFLSLYSPQNDTFSVLDTTLLADSRTFTFPNKTGTFALAGDVTAVTSGSGAPSSTPSKVGDIYIDTTSDDAYIAVGTASSADWEKSNAPTTVSDGDKGDITVSESGTTWTIDEGVVTNAKMLGMAEATIKGRAAGAGTGPVTDLTATQARGALGLATTDSPQFAGINLGHASDTTLSRVSAGVVAIEGDNIITGTAGTDTFLAKWNGDGNLVDGPDWDNEYQAFASAGRIFGGAITDAGSGKVNIAAGAGFVKNTTSSLNNGPATEGAGQASNRTLVTWDAISNFSLAGVGYNLIYWDASEGAFAVQLKENFYANFDFTRDFTIGRIYYDGTTPTIRLCGMSVWNFPRRVQMFGEEVFPVKRATGMVLSATGTRNIAITAGVLWAELVNRFETNAFNSATTGTFTYWHRDGSGGWTATTTQTQINNTQYDDGDGTLGTLSNNKYGVHWVYQVHDSTVHVVYGQGDYTLAEAQVAQAPSSLPGIVEAYATLVGKIIILKSATSFTSVESAFEVQFNGAGAVNHNDLGSIQGGTTDEYYHLTAAQATVVANTSGTNSGNETTTTIGALINGATDKATPVDADYVGLMDSAASNVLKKLSWANIKATLKTYFDTLYQTAGSYLTDIVSDTSPQLGGDLDCNGKSLTDVHALQLDATPDSDHTANGPQTNTLNAGYSSAIGDLVYFDPTAQEWLEADADAEASAGGVLLGIALEAKTDGQAMNVAMPGSFVRDDSWNWTPGAELFISTTAGDITGTAPSGSGDIVRVIGYALTADVIYFNPSGAWVEIA